MLVAQPGPEVLVGHAVGGVDELGHQAAVGVVERQLHRDTVGIAPVLPRVVVEQRVHVVALLEHAARRRATR